MKIIKNRKAELTTKQLVMIIVLIVSFIIILFLLFRLNLGETTNKEVCHNSVVLKGKAGVLAGSLDCRTNYLCISGGKDCEGISATSTIKIDLDKEGTKNKTMKAIADEMADCWWMFGEGEINYLGISDKDISGKNTCAICSIVEFDERILSKTPKVTYREFYEYLNSLEKNGETYFSYLYNFIDLEEFQSDVSYLDIELDDDFILEDEKYAIVTGIKSSAIWGKLKKEIFIWPYYLKSEDIVSELKCDTFLTKA